MKKILYSFIIFGFLMPGLYSCSDFLDAEYIFQDKQNLDSIFTKRSYSQEWLAGVFSYLSDGQNVIVASKGFQPFNFLADDMYYGDRPGNESYERFKQCFYDEGYKQNWGTCYYGIRDASVFIHNIDKNREFTQAEIKDAKAQARFVRAYLYWLLMRKYGPVCIMPDEGQDYNAEYSDLAIGRSTYEECAEFIANEMALAAADLPLIRSEREIARPTRGSALAVRARAYLYAASPLFNGNNSAWAQLLTDHEGRRLISAEYSEAKWAKAAAAAQDVIDLNRYELFTTGRRTATPGPQRPATIEPPHHPVYSSLNFPEGWADIDPFESYRSIFNGELGASGNPELIFTRAKNTNSEDVHAMIRHQMPRSMSGWNTHGATLKHVDTYHMNDGTDFPTYGLDDPRNGRPGLNPDGTGNYTANDIDYAPLPAEVSLDFANREPRFYASIAYNGAIWNAMGSPEANNWRNKQVYYYRGEQDGKFSNQPDFYLRTGISIKKFVHPDDWCITEHALSGPTKVDVDIRYAEVLLILAEALNELNGSYSVQSWDGTKTHTLSRANLKNSNSIKQVRLRGGIPDLDDAIYADQDAFRKALKRERQIELFAETHRYYDLRRWMDAEKEETMPAWGYNMNMTKNQKDLFHTPIIVSNLPTVFVDKMYLWPLHHDQLRRNKKLTQNPGWTNFQ